MLAMTCDKCRRRFTPTPEEIQADLSSSQGKKHALVMCPHCGKRNKVSPERLQHALRVGPPAETTASTTD
jgi:RNase P subunit RPR2